jgi:hypothetical protein
MLTVFPAARFYMVDNSPFTGNSSDESDSPGPIQHKSFWFNDGSTVLSVEQTLFQVHCSVLCLQSKVFTDMFRIPQPSSDTTIEGCIVICLPDKAADVADLLKAFYKPL